MRCNKDFTRGGRVNENEIRQVLVRLKDLCNELEIALGEESEGEKALRAISKPDKFEESYNAELEVEISKTLNSLGISAHVCGYKYLRYAITLVLKNNGVMLPITKEIYPRVAVEFSTTPSRAERGIRHAIEIACKKAHSQAFDKMLEGMISGKKKCATNSEFIAIVAENVRLNHQVA